MTWDQIVTFYVAKSAGAQLDAFAIRDKAKAAGLERGSYEYSTYRTPPAQGRITARRDIVPLIAEAFVELAERSRGKPLATEAALAAKAALDALNRTPS